MDFLQRSAAVAALAAVTLAAHIPTPAAGEIVYPSFHYSEQPEGDFLRAVIAAFERAHPGSRVKQVAVPYSAFWDKQLSDIQAGMPPDVATMYDPEIRSYIEAGALEPLNAYIAAAGFKLEDFVPATRLAMQDGQLYALPWTINPRALFYNKQLFAEAGLQPPTNLEEFMRAARALTKPERQQFGFAIAAKPGSAWLTYLESAPLIVGIAGGLFHDGTPRVSDPAVVTALRTYKELYDERLVPRGVETAAYREMLGRGQIAMYAGGSFIASTVKAVSAETYGNLGAVPLPFPTGKSVAVTVFLGIPKGANNKDGAAALLMTLLQDKYQHQIVEQLASFPARAGMVRPEFLRQNPWFAAFAEAAKSATSYAPEGAEQHGQEIIKIVATNLERLLFNGATPEQTAQALQAELETLLASSP
jgi:ABC-type glycerol-3-phosphate transport system substrate-binding protein